MLTSQTDAGQPRLERLDALRGLAVAGMVLYHFCYDWFVVFARDPLWYTRPPVVVWQQSVCWVFVLLSGFVWRWGRRGNLRRGLLCNLCGVLITAVTVLLIPEEAVFFGVLTFLGCTIWLLLPLDPLLCRVPPRLGLGLSALLFALTRHIGTGRISLGQHVLFTLPAALYRISWLTPLGFPAPGFSSSDYFPLFPWFFLYLVGYYLFLLYRRRSAWQLIQGGAPGWLTWVGRHSLWVYLLHQPVCMGLCWLLRKI